MVRSHVSQLGCLFIDDGGGPVKYAVNNLAILDVDEWCGEENGGGNQAKAPEGNNLDQTP